MDGGERRRRPKNNGGWIHLGRWFPRFKAHVVENKEEDGFFTFLFGNAFYVKVIHVSVCLPLAIRPCGMAPLFI